MFCTWSKIIRGSSLSIMRIVVDENIPFAEEAFGTAGEVLALPGREIGPRNLEGASALVVRSVTRVDAKLLSDSSVRFVGTCTIGTDHLDIPWLESQGIQWASAPGCNARSVAEYVVAGLACAHMRGRIDLSRHPRVGIVGAGRVGRAVSGILQALGLETLLNDPPRAESEGARGFEDLDTLFRECPILSVHLPLTTKGAHPTQGMLDSSWLPRLQRGGLLINAGRGPTIPANSLERFLSQRDDASIILDVWDPEPNIPAPIARRCLLGTPHIAGYSYEGKVEGTRMIRSRLSDWSGCVEWKHPGLGKSPVMVPEDVHTGSDCWMALCQLVLRAYDIETDSASLMGVAELSEFDRGKEFDRLRKNYPVRREFENRPVQGWDRLPEKSRDLAKRIGFSAL